ncbi:MAG: OmpA family protein, partial [Parvularculaceae bacterium]|nr:OmpA family protein [Parvularculaceae bacterium]
MKLKTILFAAAATVAIAPAAHAYEGLYGAIGAGLVKLGEDLDFDRSAGLAYNFGADADYKNGIGVYTSLGYKFSNNWRTELEFSYRTNSIRQTRGAGAGFGAWGPGQVSGDVSSYSVMANVLYDFDFGNKFATPYVGAGVGYNFGDADLVGTGPSGPLTVSDKGNSLAGQLIGGLAFKLAENLSLDLSYRYLITRDKKFDSVLSGVPGVIDHEYRGHNLFAGLRWNFGAAAPAPTPMKDCWDGSQVAQTADCPPEVKKDTSVKAEPINIIVYFDYDKSNLTPEAADLIRANAAKALANNVDRVKVTGNTDRSGSSAYNQALSTRRANVVRDALIANGIPADKIETS